MSSSSSSSSSTATTVSGSGNGTTDQKAAVIPETLTTLQPPEKMFYVSQFKNGILVENHFTSKNRLLFGRAPDCDIVLEHPSISRYHAALLWSPKNDTEFQSGINTESFWYLVDCGSTHGTICNKSKVDIGRMVKISPNNNVFKFGASTRFFTLCCTENENYHDNEEENDTSNQLTASTNKQSVENECTWGMQMTDCDDDTEETGDSLALKSIISAMKSGESETHSENAHAYMENPKRTLQQWFECEGYPYNPEVAQINGKFKSKIELPIDSQWIPVEGSLANKKKEAILDMCRKCCSILDQAQLLFPWQRQNSIKSRRKERFSDDEEDAMFDESVNIKKKHKKNDDDVNVDNFDSLNVKWKAINDELCQLKVRLATIGLASDVQPEISPDLEDSLDIYLANIQKKKFGLTLNEKIEKSNLKIKIKQLEQEQSKLEKLIQIAKPLCISNTSTVTLANDTTNERTQGDKVADDAAPVVATVTTADSPKHLSNKPDDDVPNNDVPSEVNHKEHTLSVTQNEITSKQPPSDRLKSSKAAKEIRKLKQASIVEAIEKEKVLEKRKALALPVEENAEDFVGWLPPINQSGDGKTHLNDKFGY